MKLLIIEDDEFLRRAYQITAKNAGFIVSLAADGAAGLAMVAAEMPDVILTDVLMPNVDGMEVIQRLKGEPATAHIPVVVLSSSVVPEESVEFLKAGASAFYSKSTTILSVVMDHLLALCLSHRGQSPS
jgi:CheY-like chemotaxis protein